MVLHGGGIRIGVGDDGTVSSDERHAQVRLSHQACDGCLRICTGQLYDLRTCMCDGQQVGLLTLYHRGRERPGQAPRPGSCEQADDKEVTDTQARSVRLGPSPGEVGHGVLPAFTS